MLKLTPIADAYGLVSISWEVTVLVQTIRQLPPEHVSPDGQAAAVPHWPQVSQVCRLLPLHWVALGVQTGVGGHEHAPQAQLVEHVSEP
jgi:hypothetical protein